MIFTSLMAKLGFDTTQWTAGKNTAVKDLKDLEKQTASFRQQLKASFGKGSDLAQYGKILAGGGAIAGLMMVNRELDASVQKVREISENWGKMTGADRADAIARAVPIFGQLYNTARDLRELVTGEAAEEKNITDELDKQAKKAAEVSKRYDERRAASIAQKTLEQNLTRQAELSGLSGVDANGQNAKNALDDQMKAARQKFDALNKGRSPEALREFLSSHSLQGFEALHSDSLDEYDKTVQAANTIYENAMNKTRQEQKDADDKVFQEAAVDRAKYMDDAAKKQAEKEKQMAVDNLETRRDELKDQIDFEKEGIKAASRRAEVTAIRGGNAGIVTEIPTDPNTAILTASQKELVMVNQQLKDLNRGTPTDSAVAVAF